MSAVGDHRLAPRRRRATRAADASARALSQVALVLEHAAHEHARAMGACSRGARVPVPGGHHPGQAAHALDEPLAPDVAPNRGALALVDADLQPDRAPRAHEPTHERSARAPERSLLRPPPLLDRSGPSTPRSKLGSLDGEADRATRRGGKRDGRDEHDSRGKRVESGSSDEGTREKRGAGEAGERRGQGTRETREAGATGATGGAELMRRSERD